MNTQPREKITNESDYKTFIPHFSRQSIETIKNKFNATTQYVHKPTSTHLTRLFCSPFPALNIPRRKESIATDNIYADTPAIDCGYTRTQFYCETDLQVCDIYGMKTDK